MEKVNLYTADGRMVTEIEIPPFQTHAEGILWGSRCFFWSGVHSQYREGLLYIVPQVRVAA